MPIQFHCNVITIVITTESTMCKCFVPSVLCLFHLRIMPLTRCHCVFVSCDAVQVIVAVGWKIYYLVNRNLCPIICCHFFREMEKDAGNLWQSFELCQHFTVTCVPSKCECQCKNQCALYLTACGCATR